MKNPEQPTFEKTEKISIPDETESQVPYQEVCKVAQSLQLEDYEQFEFNNQTHQLIFCDKEDGKPIEFHKSTQLDGYDIYIWESVRTKGDDFLRAILIHEIAEFTIKRLCFDISKTIEFEEDHRRNQESHNLAKLYEKKFKLENMGVNRQHEFEIFSKELEEREL